jgi:hypothetical protein
MNYPHFVRIEQETATGGTQYFVVHTQDPQMAVRFAVEVVDGVAKPGTIQRVSLPNSCVGRYSEYVKLLTKAEAFFRASLNPVESSGGRITLAESDS